MSKYFFDLGVGVYLKRYKYYLITFLAVLFAFYFALPASLFSDPYSTVIESADGRLLGASVADDGQWRFPAIDSLPEKYEKAVTLFEDEHFYYHPGFNPFALARATYQNINADRVVSGGSTITMQLIRLSRKNRSRTLWEKLIELVLAVRVECSFSKDEILAQYASHAPFGGNVVGLNAATWRYFRRGPFELSWGEAALLAVLPNSPALIHPGRNRASLMNKRNRLLVKLRNNGEIDSLTCQLAMEEGIPEAPLDLPKLAPHLLTRVIKDGGSGQRIRTTIDASLQSRVNRVIDIHHRHLRGNEVYNAAAIVADVNTGNVLSYVGNVSAAGAEHDSDVDIITAPRSTGSTLKPFLYAAMMNEGQLLPEMLVPDVPIFFNGFAPKNFSKSYDGAVPANKALARSLNIPAVALLKTYRYEKFYSLLKELGMTSLGFDPDHYGLALILGGAEGSLWDLSGMYAGMARTLNFHQKFSDSFSYQKHAYRPLTYEQKEVEIQRTKDKTLSAASIYHTFEALLDVYRPTEESEWRLFENSKKVAWKTGTSFGYRDGWAIGVTSGYVVGVWVGNADGEGRPGLTGLKAAAPIMFDIFDLLPSTPWFAQPTNEMQPLKICSQSGYQASDICPETHTEYIIKAAQKVEVCPYHQLMHVDSQGYQVNSECESVNNMKHISWFVLPPVQAYYYRNRNPSYKKMPPFRKDCMSEVGQLTSMELIYPKPNAKIFIPRELDGSVGNAVFEVAHRRPESTVFWHLNGKYVGETKRIHQLSLSPSPGKYIITLVDENGETLKQAFEVISE